MKSSLKRAALLTLVLAGNVWGETEADPFAANPPPNAETAVANLPRNPNHLEPIRAYDPDGYDQAVFKSLIGDKQAELWMVVKPSFSPEHAVILRHERHYAPSHQPGQKPESEKWVVEAVEAKKQIWHWKDVGGGRSELDIHPTSEVTRRQCEVTEAFATAIADAWQPVLRQTRYPQTGSGGLDGTTFQFYRFPDYFGETWSPDSGLPGKLTDLGLLLMELAKDEGKAPAAKTEECLALAAKIKTAATEAEPAANPPSATGTAPEPGEENKNQAEAYAKALSLSLSYQPVGKGEFRATLKNTSTEQLVLHVDPERIEGAFTITDASGKPMIAYDKIYLQKLQTGLWISGLVRLQPSQEIHWQVGLEQLVYVGPQEHPVTPQSLAAKSVALQLEKLAVFPAPKQTNVPVKIQSNRVAIPAQ